MPDVSDARGARIIPGTWRLTFQDESFVDYVFSATPGPGVLPLQAWAGIDRAARARQHPGNEGKAVRAFMLVHR